MATKRSMPYNGARSFSANSTAKPQTSSVAKGHHYWVGGHRKTCGALLGSKTCGKKRTTSLTPSVRSEEKRPPRCTTTGSFFSGTPFSHRFFRLSSMVEGLMRRKHCSRNCDVMSSVTSIAASRSRASGRIACHAVAATPGHCLKHRRKEKTHKENIKKTMNNQLLKTCVFLPSFPPSHLDRRCPGQRGAQDSRDIRHDASGGTKNSGGVGRSRHGRQLEDVGRLFL